MGGYDPFMAYVNQDAPPDVRMTADPMSAAIGEVRPGRSVDDVQASLVAGGVPADRIHFLHGDGGIAFLDDLGTWLSRLVSQTWQDARDSLGQGKVLVAVHDIEKVDASRVRQLLEEAGVERIRTSGAWTWTE